MKNAQKTDLKVKLVPLGDRVLVQAKAEEKEKTESGIYLPTSSEKERPEEGIVVAVGEGTYQDGKLIPVQVHVGDKVLFSKYAYDDVKVAGEEYIMLKEENILAIIK